MPFFNRFAKAEGQYRPLLLLGLGGMFFIVGNGAVWFLLPILAEHLFTNLFVVGLLMAVPSMVAMMCDIPLGGFSDHVGRKRIFLMGIALMGVLGLILPFVNSLARFAIFMVFYGIGNLCVIVPMKAYVMEVAPKGRTSEFFGIFEGIYQMGMAMGAGLAGYLIAWGIGLGTQHTGIFYFLASLASFLALLVLKETVVDVESFSKGLQAAWDNDRLFLKSLRDYRSLHYSGVAVLISTFVIVLVDGIVWTIGPLYTTYDIKPMTVGLILNMFIVPFILFEAPAGWVADRLGKIQMFIVGLSIAGIFLVLFGLEKSPTMLMFLAFIATTGLAFARPALDGFLTDVSAGKERGGIAGVWTVAEDSAYVAGPILGGLFAELWGVGAAFVGMGCLLLLVMPVIYLILRTNQTVTTSTE
jgi:MFS family permease